MPFKKVMEQAKTHREVAKRIKKGFYLSSVLVQAENFQSEPRTSLVFFHPKDQSVFTVGISPFEVGKISAPAVKGHYPELEFGKCLDVEQALEKFKKYAESQKLRVVNVLCTLREGKWTAHITTQDLKAHVVALDAKTGQITRQDIASLTRMD